MVKISRREFMAGAAGAVLIGRNAMGAGADFWNVGGEVRKPKPIKPGAKLRIGFIGIGGRGNAVGMELKDQEYVALCDVDDKRAAFTKEKFTPLAKLFPKARYYKDYRKMLVEMDDEIDAVVIATPDHSHFPAAMMAIQMGKHVYCEKPMAHTLWETRQLTLAARKHGVATQMGNQRHANSGLRTVREWIEADAIGPVREVHLWTNRPNQRHFSAITIEHLKARPKDTPPVPAGLDWNLWLGNAKERPYHPMYVPVQWRSWYEFGSGSLGDMGCHIFDAPFWALDLGWPTSVEAQTAPLNDETYPEWSIITWQFPARGDKPPVKVVWYDGGKKPPRPKEMDPRSKFGDGGQLYVGEKYKILSGSYANGLRIVPNSVFGKFKKNRPAEKYPRSPGHYAEWVDACKGGEAAGSNFDYAGPLTEVVLLGNLAVRAGKKIECDPKTGRVLNMPEDHPFIKPRYRAF